MRSDSRHFKMLGAVGLLVACLGVSSIDSVLKYSWGENIGWINWADANAGAQGVAHHGSFLSGFAWGENVGWINFGDGTPGSGTGYVNANGTDSGVNVMSDNNLTGYAWGENIGWINFNTIAALAAFNQHARWDPAAGRFRGYVWGENVGWINLDDATHYVAVVGAGVTSWRSVRTHGGTPQSIVLDASASTVNGITGPTSESRQNGIQRIEVDFNVPVTVANAGMITVTGRTTSAGGVLGPQIVYLPTSITSVSAATIAITFPVTPAVGHLPDQTCFTITLGSGLTNPVITGDLDVNVRSLLADTTSSGDITLSDAVAVKSRYGNALSTDARFDVDLSGAINNLDAVAAKNRVASPSRKALCQ
jgi:hypothetical protein